jgi:hypothetical protein
VRVRKQNPNLNDDINSSIPEIKLQLKELSTRLESIIDNTADLVSTANVDASLNDRETMTAMHSSMEGFHLTLKKSLSRIKTASEAIVKMRTQTTPSTFDASIRSMRDCLNAVSEELAIGEAYTARMLNLINIQLSPEEPLKKT